MGGCLSDETASALFAGKLDPAAMDAVDVHTAECDACRALVASLARGSASGTPVTPAVVEGDGASVQRWLDALSPIASELAHRQAQRRVGTTLAGKWRIESLLGVGGMSQVFAAVHANGRKVAVKILKIELTGDADLVRRFLLEAYAANKVDHPNVIAILDSDVTEDGAPFLVMERLEGETLRQRMARGHLGVDEARHIGAEVLSVLSVAHASGVVHRDIKPENVFLTAAGQVKVLDFGIARLRDRAIEVGTRTGVTMGTPAFMAPEQARGETSRVDARSDLWAVGAMLYAAVHGDPPHGSSQAADLLFRVMTQPAPRLPRSFPAAFVDTVARALAFERDARWASADEMRAALLRENAPRRKWRVLGPVALAALALAGGVAVVATRSRAAHVASAPTAPSVTAEPPPPVPVASAPTSPEPPPSRPADPPPHGRVAKPPARRPDRAAATAAAEPATATPPPVTAAPAAASVDPYLEKRR